MKISNNQWSPLDATSKLYDNYFNFFLTSFAPNNPELQATLKKELSSDYLQKGPYISISHQFERGILFNNFENVRLDKLIKKAFPYISYLYKHQEDGISNILNGNNTIAAVPTGSGKTEIFLIPILDYCLEHKGEPGIKAIIVYPMNALANDQVERLRKTLWILNKDLPQDQKVTFAIYNSDTPENTRDMKEGDKSLEGLMENCFLHADDKSNLGCNYDCEGKYITYNADNQTMYCLHNNNVSIDYQILTRDSIRTELPDILITNYVQLEHLLLRKDDNILFSTNSVKFLVFDEIHTYSGARGIDVALLIRRLRSRLVTNTICIGLSATLSTSDPKIRKNLICDFAGRLFGVTFNPSDIIEGNFEKFIFDKSDNIDKLEKIDELYKIDSLDEPSNEKFVINIFRNITSDFNSIKKPYSLSMGKILLQNPLFQVIVINLEKPTNLKELKANIKLDNKVGNLVSSLNDNDFDNLIWSYLRLGSLASNPKLSNPKEPTKAINSLINVNVHNFFKTIDKLYKCNKCDKIYLQPRDVCDCGYSVDEIGVCRFCGKDYLITLVPSEDLVKFKSKNKDNEKLNRITKTVKINDLKLQKASYQSEYSNKVLPLWQTYDNILTEEKDEILSSHKCIKCGSIVNITDNKCAFCGSSELKRIFLIVRKELQPKKNDNGIDIGVRKITQPTICPFCGRSYGSFSALSPISMSASTASITIFDMIYNLLPDDFKKLLIFTDNRQSASYIAGYLEDGHLDHAIRSLLFTITKDRKRIYLPELSERGINQINNWYGGNFKAFGIERHAIQLKLLSEISSTTGAQRSIENLGLIEVTYSGLETDEEFKNNWESFNLSHTVPKKGIDIWRKYLISILNLIRQDGALNGLENNYTSYDKATMYNLFDKNMPKRWAIIKGILNPRAITLRNITKKAFSVTDNESIDNILKNSFDFLRQNNLLIFLSYEKRKEKSEGFVVNDSTLIVKIPNIINKCEKCQRIYVNSPTSTCLTSRCQGTLKEINYEEYLNKNKNNYYINIYTNNKPLKMVTKEDTGALGLRERQDIESEFKKENGKGRKVDVIVATPTLELGVDIGNLLSVGLFKAPPSPANYLQRVGRAGRKEKISFNNTFLFPTPIDKLYYNSPERLIKGEIDTPIIDIENTHILQRHVNSLILEDLLVNSTEDYPYYMKNFNNDTTHEMLSDIDIKKQILKEHISLALEDYRYDQLNDMQIDSMIKTFKESLEFYSNRYKQEISAYNNYLSELLSKRDWDNVRKLDDQIKKLEKASLISYLMDMNVLPRYAFPGILVDIKDDFGYDDFGSRARNYAITEYTPLMEIYLKKKIYKSIGVDRSILTPTRKSFYICSNCEKYITEDATIFKSGCPLCTIRSSPKRIECIEPNIIFIRKTDKRINEPREYQEAVSNIYIESSPKESRELKDEKNILLSRYGDITLINIVDRVIIEGEERDIEICKDCGRVKENITEEHEHYKLGLKFKGEKCKGKYEKLALFHKMPTNVISIKISGTTNSIFGTDISQYCGEKRIILLTTLKNSIINAALYYTQAQDGEIDGAIKEDEIILYDNVDGGAGYVDKIYNNFELILKQAADIALSCKCESGCLDCIWSYRRKRDIENIDKKSVENIFRKINIIYYKPILPQKRKTQEETHLVETIYSPSYNFVGVVKLRDLLRAVKEQILITTLYVTDGKIPWPDEIEKSWVEILIGIKLSSKTDINISVLIREPLQKEHKLAVKKLLDNSIQVYIYKKEFESKLTSIVHSKLVVIDPHIPDKRHAIHMSANFSPEMWKNHDTLEFGENESWVKSTSEEIQRLMRESRKPKINEFDVSSSFESEFLSIDGDYISSTNKLLEHFTKSSSSICIMDPYLTNIPDLDKLIHNYIHRSAEIKIITAKTESDKLKELKNKLDTDGRKISIIRYFDKERLSGKETIIHDRYIIFDNNKVLLIGKGLNAIIDSINNKLKDNVICNIIMNQNEVNKYIANFNKYYNYQSAEDQIKNFTKQVY